jgi:4-amino-4-deoxy-L-arabinose transferase-like glycosyltransferase
MRTRAFLDRVGLGEASADVRFGWRIVLAVCALYVLAFLAFYPNAITNDDEAMYVRHAQIMLEGRASVVPKLDALTGESVDHVVSRYPIGTALMMVPFVALAGWKGAYLVPLLCLVGAVIVTGRWLREEGYSPLWALLVLGFPPALVMGRVAMSDVPSLAVVSVGLWLFWRGLDRGWGYWMASGFIAGVSMIWRETNAVVFAPFFAGAVLRREKSYWAIVVGGLLGVGVRLQSSTLVFGDPFFYKAPYVIDFAALLDRLPLYLLALLVFVPGGLLLVVFYRGRRWPELIAATILFVLLYLLQEYFMWGTSPLKRMILTPRYMLPILPLMALAAAEVLPRLWRRLQAWTPGPRRKLLEAVVAGVLVVWIAGVAAVAAAVHPAFAAWSLTQARISDAISSNTDPAGVLVTNIPLTRKFIRELDQKYLPVDLEAMNPDVVMDLATRFGGFHLVLLDRNDGPFGLEQTRLNAEFLGSIEAMDPNLLFDQQMSATDRLRIWRVDRNPRP